MRKLAFCICENKYADQLRGNREADQRLCFRYTDSTILDQLAILHSVAPRYLVTLPWRCNETPMEILHLVQSLYFLNSKFQASSHLLWLYSPVCVRPGRKPRRPVFSERGSIKTPSNPILYTVKPVLSDHIKHYIFWRLDRWFLIAVWK